MLWQLPEVFQARVDLVNQALEFVQIASQRGQLDFDFFVYQGALLQITVPFDWMTPNQVP